MNELVIEVKGLTKGFKKKEVLRDCSFSVPRGSVVGLLGKNGAGKSTLIKCALGLLKPESGSVKIFGEDSWDLSEQAKEKLGYVPQTPSFYSWFKVKDMIQYTASFYKNWDHELMDRLMKEWELNPNDKASKLSEGQAQKLSILLALGHGPELLIFDEPVASLDPFARRQFLKTLLDTVVDKNVTVLFSTHITSDLERVADRVGILKEGKMYFLGELDQLKDEVKCLKIVSSNGAPHDFSVPGLIRSEVSGKEALLYVRNYSDKIKLDIEQQWNAKVEVQDLNLEEIFLELVR